MSRLRRNAALDKPRSTPSRNGDIDHVLDAAFLKGLCNGVGVAASAASSFKKSIRSHIQAYFELKNRKRPQAVDAELRTIGAVVEKALRLAYREAPRHRDFQLAIGDISARLRDVSNDAVDYLAGRGQKIIVAGRKAPSKPALSQDLIDPLCYRSSEQQVAALHSLSGSLFGPHARRRLQGRPPKQAERFLYEMLACAYVMATGKAANDKSPRFMVLCDALKVRCELVDFRPEALDFAQTSSSPAAYAPVPSWTETYPGEHLASDGRAGDARLRRQATRNPSHVSQPRRLRKSACRSSEDDARPVLRRRSSARGAEQYADDRRRH